MHSNSNAQLGFTLIQVSILLLIASLVLVSVLPSMQSRLNHDRDTTVKMNSILNALRGYEAAYGYLPCPADASQSLGSNSYGRAATNPGLAGNCSGGVPAANYTDGSDNVSIGSVPVLALGLSADYALDAYGRAITYGVDTNATVCGWPSSSLAGKIAVTDNGTTNSTVAVLVSHGADGHGAWIPLTGAGGAAVRLNTGSTDADQLTNAHVNGGFTPTAILTSFVRKMPTGTFDDILAYNNSAWDLRTLPSNSPKIVFLTPPADGCYNTGQALTFTVTFSVAVAVTGTPRLALTIGSNSRYATYTGGSGTGTLVFSYTVQAGDYATSGISVASAIDLNGGSIKSGSFCVPLGFGAPDLTNVRVNSCTAVYVVDGGNSRVEKFDGNGNYVGQFGSNGTGNGQFSNGGVPANYGGIAVDSSGDIWVGDHFNSRVQRFDSNGNYLGQFGTSGTGNGQFSYVGGLAFDPNGNLYVEDYYNHRVEKFDGNGNYLSQFGMPGSPGTANGSFGDYGPTGIAVAATGNIWVVDRLNNRLQEFNSSGNWIRSVGGAVPHACQTNPNPTQPACNAGAANGQFYYPWGIAIDSSGNLWVADDWNSRVQKFDSNGNYLGQFGTNGTGNGQFTYPVGIAIDGSGNLWVSDYYQNRVQKFDSNGNYLSQLGSSGTGDGQFQSPYGIAVGR